MATNESVMFRVTPPPDQGSSPPLLEGKENKHHAFSWAAAQAVRAVLTLLSAQNAFTEKGTEIAAD